MCQPLGLTTHTGFQQGEKASLCPELRVKNPQREAMTNQTPLGTPICLPGKPTQGILLLPF